MKKLLLLFVVFVFMGAAKTYEAPYATIVLVDDDLRAFPGAEGFGKDAGVGMTRRVVFVTNTNNTGTGSLRAAIDDAESNSDFTIIIPRLGGTVTLGTDPIFSGSSGSDSNFYFAGQLAPGDGLTVRADGIGYGGALTIQGSNAVVRFLKIYGGDAMGNSADCLTVRNNSSVAAYTIQNVIIDHCLFAWGKDENIEFGAYNGGTLTNLTFSHNIVAEPFGNGYGMLLFSTDGTLNRVSIYADYFASIKDRQIYMSSCNQMFEQLNTVHLNQEHVFNISVNKVDYIGNVSKWHSNYQINAGGSSLFNYQNNTYEVAANRPSICPSGNGCCDNAAVGDFPLYVGDHLRVNDNSGNSLFDSDLTTYNAASRVITESLITPMASTEVEGYLMPHVGASTHRDAHETRLVNEFINNSRNYRPTTENDPNVGGHLTYNNGTPYTDSDDDGLSDEYEYANGGDVDINGRPATFNLPDGRIIDQSGITNYATQGFTHIDVFLGDMATKADGTDDWDSFSTVPSPPTGKVLKGRSLKVNGNGARILD